MGKKSRKIKKMELSFISLMKGVKVTHYELSTLNRKMKQDQK